MEDKIRFLIWEIAVLFYAFSQCTNEILSDYKFNSNRTNNNKSSRIEKNFILL